MSSGESMVPIFTPHHSRVRLGFAQTVESSFDFLVRQFGFRLVDSQPTFVRYESRHTFVNIYHGRSSYELGVEIGHSVRVDGKVIERKFRLGDIIGLEHDLAEVGYRDYSTSEKKPLTRFIEQLADWTQRYGSKALNGDPVTFDSLEAQSARQSRALMDGWEAERLRATADDAWHRKDWSRVINAYTEMEAELKTIELKQSERARLSYARRKLNDDSDRRYPGTREGPATEGLSQNSHKSQIT